MPSQDDTYTDTYITTIGVDFVSLTFSKGKFNRQCHHRFNAGAVCHPPAFGEEEEGGRCRGEVG